MCARGSVQPSRVVAAVVVLLTGLLTLGAGAEAAPSGLETRQNAVAALDVDEGTELWIARPTEQVSYLGAIPGRHVVIATRGSCDSGSDARLAQGLVALDAKTGRKRWENSSTDFVLATVRGMATYVFAVVPVDAGGVVVTASDAGVLRAYNANDGTTAWTRAANDAPLGVTETSVFAANREQGSSNVLRVLNRRTGQVRWEHGGLSGTPAHSTWLVVLTTRPCTRSEVDQRDVSSL